MKLAARILIVFGMFRHKEEGGVQQKLIDAIVIIKQLVTLHLGEDVIGIRGAAEEPGEVSAALARPYAGMQA
jgi:hypothetical protein